MTKDKAAEISQKTGIKLCPFCGGIGQPASITADNGVEQYIIRCVCCAAEGPWEKSESGALRLWNMRAAPQVLNEAPKEKG